MAKAAVVELVVAAAEVGVTEAVTLQPLPVDLLLPQQPPRDAVLLHLPQRLKSQPLQAEAPRPLMPHPQPVVANAPSVPKVSWTMTFPTYS